MNFPADHELKEILKKPNAVVLDIRPPEEVQKLGDPVEGAVNIPFDREHPETFVVDESKLPDKDAYIVCH